DNQSTDTYTSYFEPNTSSTVYAVGVRGEDVSQAITDALAVIDPSFSSAPVQVQEQEISGEMWTFNVYLGGQNLRLALSKNESTDGVYVVVILDASQAGLAEVGAQVDPLLLGIEYK
ncbi:MAG: hypothetical protein KJ043_04220, partial [Anaerolineae bacterium]|nr:hypothetical protein [Anaerolineae bacterium]